MTDFNHSDHSKQVYNSPKGYEELGQELKSNHFSYATETKNGVIQSLHINAPDSINVDSKVKRLTEILEGWNVSVHAFKNQGYISVTLVK